MRGDYDHTELERIPRANLFRATSFVRVSGPAEP